MFKNDLFSLSFFLIIKCLFLLFVMSFLNKFIFEFNIDEVILLNLFFNCDYNAFVKENPLNIIYIVFSLFIYAFITETKNIYLFEVFNQ